MCLMIWNISKYQKLKTEKSPKEKFWLLKKKAYGVKFWKQSMGEVLYPPADTLVGPLSHPWFEAGPL